MIAGSLDLKFTADIQAALTEIRRLETLTGGAMSSMQNATAGVVKTFAALGPVIAAALAAISVSAVVGQFQQLVKAAGDLQDLAEKTGATAEALGGLVVAAKVGGTTIDAVAAASVKLTKSMNGIDDESKAAGAAIAALGLNLKDFKALSPTAQMEAIAKALGGFEEGAGKTAVAVTLLGKSGAEMLPFLKALDEAGGAHNILTAEQIRLADDFGDRQAKSRAELSLHAQALATTLIPVLTAVQNVTRDLIKDFFDANKAQGEFAANRAVLDWGEAAAVALGTVLESVVMLMKILRAFAGSFEAVFADIQLMGAVTKENLLDKMMGGNILNDAFEKRETIVKAANARYVKLWNEDGTLITTAIKKSFADQRLAMDDSSNLDPRDYRARTTKPKPKLATDVVGTGPGTKEQASEYDRLTAAIKAKIEAGKIEAAEGEKASESQKFQIKMAIEMASGKLKVTDAQKASLKLAIAELDTLERAAKVKLYDKRLDEERLQIAEELAQAFVAESKAREAGRNAVVDYGKAIDDANALTRFEISLADQTDAGRERALAQYRIELDLKKQIEAIDKNAGFDQAGRDEEKARASAAAARASAGVSATLRLSEINKTRAEWDKFYDSIYQGLTDSLYRGFEAGKGFFKSFWDGIKNLFKTTVLKLAVQGVVTGVTGALGMNTSANAGNNMLGMANNVSTANSLYGAASGYSSGVNTTAGLLGAGSTAGASAASLGYANAVGVVGGDALGALISANASWAGVATGSAAAAEAALAASAATAAGTTAAAGTGAAAAGAGAGAASGLAAIPVYGWIALAVIAVAAYFGGRGDKEATGGGIEGSFGKGGFEGNRFSTWKQDGGWFHSDRTGKDLGALDAGAQKQLAAGYAAVQVGAAQSALALGLSADAIVNYSESISIVLGDDQEANAKTISKLFADMSNNMATAVAPGLSAFAKQGETASTTLARLGGSLTTVNAWMGLLRGNLLDVSMASGDAASKLVDAFGGLEAMGTSVQHYYDLYFSESERAADTTARMTKALASVGLAMPETKEAFRAMATGLDLTSDSGRAAYATMLALAPTFAASADAIAALAKTAADKAQAEAEATAGKALAVSEKHDELTLALLRAQGDETGAVAIERQKELAALYAMSPALRDMQSQVYGLNDAAVAAAAEASTLAENTRLASVSAAATAAGEAAAKAITDKQGILDLALMRAQGNETGAVAIERKNELAALYAMNTTLGDTQAAIYAATDATAALAVAAKATEDAAKAAADAQAALYAQADAAVAGLQRSVIAQKATLQTAYDAALAAAQTGAATLAAIDAKATEDAKTAAQDRLSAITDIFRALGGALKSAQIESDSLTAARRRAAQQVLSDAMAGARAGQLLTAYAGLEDALSVIAQPSQDLFATFGDYATDQARTATDIIGLRDIAGAQKSLAQMMLDATIAAGDASVAGNKTASDATLKALKDQFDADNSALDVQLAYWGQQLNALKGIDDRVLSVDASIAKLVALQAQVLNVSGAAGGKATDSQIKEAWATTGNSGSDDASIRRFYDLAIATGTGSSRVDTALGFTPGTALKWALDKGLPSFDVGTDYVQQDMLAMIHEGEAVLTPADAASYRSGQSGSDPALLAELRALRQEVASLRSEQGSGFNAVARNTGIAADILQRADDGDGIVMHTKAEAEAA